VEIEPVVMETKENLGESPFAKLNMHYQLPGETQNRVDVYDVPYHFTPFDHLPDYYRFSTSVALFGDLLKKSIYTQKTSWDALELMARASYDPNNVSQNEYVLLIDKAKKIYHKDKKKKQVVVD